MTSYVSESDDDCFQSSDDELITTKNRQDRHERQYITNEASDEPWIIELVKQHADNILHLYSPVMWCALLVLFVDAKALFDLWYMPFLGVLAAFLANSVPIGGGIVYIPALSLLGAQITLGASFTIATMPIGNGIFGFLRWLLKDPTVFIWESFPYTVIPNWIGSLIAMSILPAPDQHLIKLCFGLFSFIVGILVVMSLYRGGLHNVISDILPIATTPPQSMENKTDSVESGGRDGKVVLIVEQQTLQNYRWLIIIISFLEGIVITPNIGIGPALITYFLLVLCGYKEQRAMVTGIVTGGWVCAIPFVVNISRNDVPYALWVMVLPGVFYGAKVSVCWICF